MTFTRTACVFKIDVTFSIPSIRSSTVIQNEFQAAAVYIIIITMVDIIVGNLDEAMVH